MNNPFDFSRGMYESWEKAMAEAMEKLTQDEAFVKNLTKAFTGTLDVRTQISSQLEKYLKSINMPTRTDLERLLGYLQRIESKLLDLEDRLDTLKAPSATAAPDTAAAPGKKKQAQRTTSARRTKKG